MLFNSLEFLLFFPVVTALFYALPHRFRWVLLLGASWLFYGAWSPWYLALLVATSAFDWFVGVRIADAPERRDKRRWLLLSLVSNLGILFFFKYYNLLNDLAIDAFGWAGVGWPLPRSSFLLPVGISFYTFQSLSYTIDVFRNELPAERRPGHFLLYVAYFPQLVAGPVERASRLLPQLDRPVAWDVDRAVSGLRLAGWGMFKKVVIADRLADVVNTVFAAPEQFGAPAHLLAVFLFGYQVYCDFSGYSDIAVGTARVLGVDLMRNFDQPYLARSMSELWSRWHISMTTWFRDYVYLPLGGSRVSTPRWVLNVYLVFVGSGLWHGAEWGLVAWGAVHATFLVVERLAASRWSGLLDRVGLAGAPRGLLSWAITFACWQFSLVFFRSDDFADAVYILSHAGVGWGVLTSLQASAAVAARLHLDGGLLAYILFLCPFVEVVEYAVRTASWSDRVRRWPTLARWLLDWALIFGILVLGAFEDTPFVYFQF